MQIETTRELYDKVFVLHKDRIYHLSIYVINVNIGSIFDLIKENTRITEIYWLKDEHNTLTCYKKPEECFSTKEELINSLSINKM